MRNTSDIDQEANAFAMELLMPRQFLIEDIRQMGGIDISDDKQIDRLARKYKVGTSLMAIRLGQLLPLASQDRRDPQ